MNPAVAQWLSAAVNGALDKPMVTGAIEAQYETKYNRNLRRVTIAVARSI